jgi:hypothetical protein
MLKAGFEIMYQVDSVSSINVGCLFFFASVILVLFVCPSPKFSVCSLQASEASQ